MASPEIKRAADDGSSTPSPSKASSSSPPPTSGAVPPVPPPPKTDDGTSPPSDDVVQDLSTSDIPRTAAASSSSHPNADEAAPPPPPALVRSSSARAFSDRTPLLRRSSSLPLGKTLHHSSSISGTNASSLQERQTLTTFEDLNLNADGVDIDGHALLLKEAKDLAESGDSFFDNVETALEKIKAAGVEVEASVIQELQARREKLQVGFADNSQLVLQINQYLEALSTEAKFWKARVEDILAQPASESLRQELSIDDHFIRPTADEDSSLLACAVASGDTVWPPSNPARYPPWLALLRLAGCFGLDSDEPTNIARFYGPITVLHPHRFRELRQQFIAERDYLASLSRCERFNPQGGKSNAVFDITKDKRFLIKQIQEVEFKALDRFADDYITYILGPRRSCLAKIFGLYQVMHNGRAVYLYVMENLSYGRSVEESYDVKGLVYNRSSDPGAKVGLDESFLIFTKSYKVVGAEKDRLSDALKNDIAFLARVGVMDYSLYIGVDRDRRQFFYGVIDYLRPYTWDKRIENLYKTLVIVPRGVRPTIIPPVQYGDRFYQFIIDYFTS